MCADGGEWGLFCRGRGGVCLAFCGHPSRGVSWARGWRLCRCGGGPLYFRRSRLLAGPPPRKPGPESDPPADGDSCDPPSLRSRTRPVFFSMPRGGSNLRRGGEGPARAGPHGGADGSSAGDKQPTQNWHGQGESDCLIKTKHCAGRRPVRTQCDFCPVL